MKRTRASSSILHTVSDHNVDNWDGMRMKVEEPACGKYGKEEVENKSVRNIIWKMASVKGSCIAFHLFQLTYFVQLLQLLLCR